MELTDIIRDIKAQNNRISCLIFVDKENENKAIGYIESKEWVFTFYQNEALDDCLKIIREKKINIIITETKYNYLMNRLLWYAIAIRACIYIDTNNPYQIEKNHNLLMNTKLWDAVALSASNDIEAGGWVNSYTKKHFIENEMSEFSENAYLKLKDVLGDKKDKKVLEIGCASGITMFRLLPYVSEYVGIDLSKINIKKNEEKAKQQNIANLKLFAMPADKLLDLNERDFDLIIMNSVAQYFPGINYMREVILNGIDIMKPHGVIYLGDIMDLDKRDILHKSLIDYKNMNPTHNTKIDLSNELFFGKDYFNDLNKTINEITHISFSDKIGTIKNELFNYRYDVLITVDKTSCKLKRNYKLTKYQFGGLKICQS